MTRCDQVAKIANVGGFRESDRFEKLQSSERRHLLSVRFPFLSFSRYLGKPGKVSKKGDDGPRERISIGGSTVKERKSWEFLGMQEQLCEGRERTHDFFF